VYAGLLIATMLFSQRGTPNAMLFHSEDEIPCGESTEISSRSLKCVKLDVVPSQSAELSLRSARASPSKNAIVPEPSYLRPLEALEAQDEEAQDTESPQTMQEEKYQKPPQIKRVKTSLEEEPVFPLLATAWQKWKDRNGHTKHTLGHGIAKMCEDTHEMIEIMRPRLIKFESKEQQKLQNKKLMDYVAAYYYATDLSFGRNITPDELILGIKRRCAWEQNPPRMVMITFAQVAICFLVMLSPNSPMNTSTMVTGFLYVLAMSTTKDYVVTKELIKHNQQLMGSAKKKAGTAGLLLARLAALGLLPLLVVAVCVTFLIDFFIGKMKVLDYYDVLNTAVDFIVVFSRFSVGLRSGTPVNAIQTFAAFECLRTLDELIIETYFPDLDVEVGSVDVDKTKQYSNLKVRITVYVIVVILLAVFLYLTAWNICVVFFRPDKRAS
jgi:hypothetical protein